MTDFELNRDCRHVHWDRPCAPHKKRGTNVQAEDFMPIDKHRPQHPTQLAENIRRLKKDLGL